MVGTGISNLANLKGKGLIAKGESILESDKEEATNLQTVLDGLKSIGEELVAMDIDIATDVLKSKAKKKPSKITSKLVAAIFPKSTGKKKEKEATGLKFFLSLKKLIVLLVKLFMITSAVPNLKPCVAL